MIAYRFIDREYSLNYGKSILVCASKCGEKGECADSTMCDRASNVCISNGRSLSNFPSINQGLSFDRFRVHVIAENALLFGFIQRKN